MLSFAYDSKRIFNEEKVPRKTTNTEDRTIIVYTDASSPPDALAVETQALDKSDHSSLTGRTQNSELSYSCKLPPEVLGRVFLYIACTAATEKREYVKRRLLSQIQPDPYEKNSWEWIKTISHVCAYWRAVALEYSALWGEQISLGRDVEWTAELIKRAKTSLLDVEAQIGPYLPQVKRHAEEVLAHLPQTKALVLVDWTAAMATPGSLNAEAMAESSEDNTEFGKALASLQNAPALESCSVYAPGWRGRRPIPENFLKDAPSLRALCLDKWVVEPTFHLLSDRLTTLEIVRAALPSMKVLFRTLAQTPNLEKLVLDRVLRPILGGEMPIYDEMLSNDESVGDIHLSHLSYLKVNADISPSLRFLRLLNCPRTTNISLRLGCIAIWMEIGKIAPMVAELGQLLGGHMDQVSFLHVKNMVEGNFRLQVWENPRMEYQSRPTLPEAEPRVDVEFMDVFHDANKRVETLGGLFTGLPIRDSLRIMVANGREIDYFGSLEAMSRE